MSYIVSQMLTSAQKALDTLCTHWGAVQDGENGFGYTDGFGRVYKDAPRSATTMGRILYALSAAHRSTGRTDCLEGAGAAYRYIRDVMTDPVHGGVWQSVDVNGKPLAEEKRTYEQAFVIYGLSEYVLASGDEGALQLAQTMYRLLEQARGGDIGYADYYTRDWSAHTGGTLRPDKVKSHEHTLDSQTHIIEAYTDLLRAWSDEGLRTRLKELVELGCDTMYQPDSGKIGQAFTADWQLMSDDESYGDNAEVSWFLSEADELIGDAELIDRTRRIAIRMTDRAISAGHDVENGGLYDRTAGGALNDMKIWWNQCEAVNGCLNAWQITKNEDYLQLAGEFWAFMDKHQIADDGTWRARTQKDGTLVAAPDTPSGNVCPYHNIRTCIRTIVTLNSEE